MQESEEEKSHELVLMDQSITSMLDITQLRVPQSASQIRVLNLHSNSIRNIQCLEFATGLIELNLSSNDIQKIDGLLRLERLESLNLACNNLVRVEGLVALVSMTSLVLSYNRIHDLSGLSELGCNQNSLKLLDLRGNFISSLQQLDNLTGFFQLETLTFQQLKMDNPICRSPEYTAKIMAMVGTSLLNLDGQPVDDSMRLLIRRCSAPPSRPFAANYTNNNGNMASNPICSTPRIDAALRLRKDRRGGNEDDDASTLAVYGEKIGEKKGSTAAALDKLEHEVRIERLETMLAKLLPLAQQGHRKETNATAASTTEASQTSESEVTPVKPRRKSSSPRLQQSTVHNKQPQYHQYQQQSPHVTFASNMDYRDPLPSDQSVLTDDQSDGDKIFSPSSQTQSEGDGITDNENPEYAVPTIHENEDDDTHYMMMTDEHGENRGGSEWPFGAVRVGGGYAPAQESEREHGMKIILLETSRRLEQVRIQLQTKEEELTARDAQLTQTIESMKQKDQNVTELQQQLEEWETRMKTMQQQQTLQTQMSEKALSEERQQSKMFQSKLTEELDITKQQHSKEMGLLQQRIHDLETQLSTQQTEYQKHIATAAAAQAELGAVRKHKAEESEWIKESLSLARNREEEAQKRAAAFEAEAARSRANAEQTMAKLMEANDLAKRIEAELVVTKDALRKSQEENTALSASKTQIQKMLEHEQMSHSEVQQRIVRYETQIEELNKQLQRSRPDTSDGNKSDFAKLQQEYTEQLKLCAELKKQKQIAEQNEARSTSVAGELTDLVKDQRGKMVQMAKERKQLREDIKNLHKELDAVELTLSKLRGVESELQRTNEELLLEKERNGDLHEELKVLEENWSERVAALESKIINSKMGTNQLQDEKEKCMKQIETFQDTIKIKDRMINDKDQSIDALKKQLGEMAEAQEKMSQSHRRQQESLQNKLDDEVEKKNIYRRKMDAMEASMQHMEDELADLRESNKRLQDAAEEANEEIRAKDKMMQYVEREVEQLQEQMRTMEKKHQATRDQAMEAKQSEIEGLHRALDTANEKIEELKLSLTAKENAVQAKQKEVNEAKAKVESTEAEMRVLLTSMEKQKAATTKKIKQLTKAFNELQQESSFLS